MIEQTRDNIDYYYDSHPTEEDLMGESRPHASLIHYLVEVLTWLFRNQACAIYENFNFFQTPDEHEYPLAPDIALIKGITQGPIRSWRVGVHGPAPHVVFEVASEKTWGRDLAEKPAAYSEMGVQEYYAYDPYEPLLFESRREGQRLFGWQRDPSTGLLRALSLRPDGTLWSPHLGSFLVPDGAYLHLYDRSGRLLLTEAEAEAEKARTFAEKLRSLGVDPEQLL
jgi:Uma2 family endonuclease